jgi:predicted dienelactone hydrolase
MRKRLFPRGLLCLLAILLGAGQAAAAHPGFRTIGIWDEAGGIRLDLGVWYPVRQSSSSTESEYGGWLIRANLRAAPLSGPLPLIVLSHPGEGSRFALHELAAFLAAGGFVVAAPEHRGDNALDMSFLYTPRQLKSRGDELLHTIDALLADPEIGPVIDPARIGAIGMGAGGAAALLAAGGHISPDAWQGWKRNAPAGAPYMFPWARRRLDALAADPDLRQSRPDRRIRCAVVIAPAYSMFFDAASLAQVRIPILLIAFARDRFNPGPQYLDRLEYLLPAGTQALRVEDADPVALLSQQDESSQTRLPGYAVAPDRHMRVLEEVRTAVLPFLLRSLSDSAPPPLPAAENSRR